MTKLPPICFPSFMSSLFFWAKKVLFEPDRGDGDGFIRLPPLPPLCSAAARQLSNSQARERGSERAGPSN